MLLLQKLYTYVQSRIVTNTSLKRGTSKCIYALTQEIVPSNAASAGKVSQVSATRETMSDDIIRKSKFHNHLYIFQALQMRELREEIFQKIFTYDSHENSSHRGIKHLEQWRPI
jgi:hypothetical protein